MSNIERVLPALELPSEHLTGVQRLDAIRTVVRTEAKCAAIFEGLAKAEFIVHGNTKAYNEDRQRSKAHMERLEEYIVTIIGQYEGIEIQ